MGFRRKGVARVTLLFGLVAVFALALPAFASAARILYASGHTLDPTRLATFGGHTLVDPGNGNAPEDGFDGCSDSEWATALARTDFDVLVVGEDAPGCLGTLSSDTLTAIGNYVRSGRPIIVLGAHGSENDFLNAVFGFSTTNAAADAGENLSATLQSGASGTPFSSGPPTLLSEDLTEILGDTPGTTMYSGPEGVWVFTAGVGAGTVTYLAWDFCCGSDAGIDDWYRVLDRAIQNALTKPVPAAAPSDRCQGRKATIIGTPGNDNIVGTAGADVIVALGGADKVNGLGGNDVICGRKGKDKLKGGPGNDRLQGNKSADRLIGNGGTDTCRGGLGKDTASSCESVKGL